MKRIIASLMTGLFLITGIGLSAQPGSGRNGSGQRGQMRKYMENTIRPELIKQKKIWMDALTKSETEELLKMKQEQEAIRSSMQGKITPENRENVQKAHFSAFKPRLDKIVDAHPRLKERYIKEMNQNKEKWTTDLKAFKTDGNNMNRGQGPAGMMDKISDPAFILMWNPDRNYRNMGMHKQMNSYGKGMNKGNKTGYNKNKPVAPAIQIYPQPATETVVVRVNGVKNKQVEAGVYNAQGKKVKELYAGMVSIPRLVNTFDVSNWKAGMYTVKVTFGERTMTMDFKVE